MKIKSDYIFKLLFGVGIVVALLCFIPYEQIKNSFLEANKKLVILNLVFFLFLYFIGSLRWNILLRAVGIKIKQSETFMFSMSGLFLNLFCPSIIAQDIFRGTVVSRKSGKTLPIVFSTILLDRVSGFVGLMIIAFMNLIIFKAARQDPVVRTSLMFLGIVLISIFSIVLIKSLRKATVFFFSFNNSIKIKVMKLCAKLSLIKRNPYYFLTATIVSVFIHVGVILTFWLSALAIGLNVPLPYFFSVVPLILVLTVLPISVGGLGTREAGAAYFFSKIGVTAASAVAMSFFNFIFILISALLGGLIYVAFSHRWLQSDEKKS